MRDLIESPNPTHVETGSMGRVACSRIAPNEDLVQSIEAICQSQGFKNAFVRGALGSLVDACLARHDGTAQHIKGPAIEVVSLAGEVRSHNDGTLKATLTGVVADTEGNVHGGLFVSGFNTICMTFEVTLEEWLPSGTL